MKKIMYATVSLLALTGMAEARDCAGISPAKKLEINTIIGKGPVALKCELTAQDRKVLLGELDRAPAPEAEKKAKVQAETPKALPAKAADFQATDLPPMQEMAFVEPEKLGLRVYGGERTSAVSPGWVFKNPAQKGTATSLGAVLGVEYDVFKYGSFSTFVFDEARASVGMTPLLTTMDFSMPYKIGYTLPTFHIPTSVTIPGNDNPISLTAPPVYPLRELGKLLPTKVSQTIDTPFGTLKPGANLTPLKKLLEGINMGNEKARLQSINSYLTKLGLKTIATPKQVTSVIDKINSYSGQFLGVQGTAKISVSVHSQLNTIASFGGVGLRWNGAYVKVGAGVEKLDINSTITAGASGLPMGMSLPSGLMQFNRQDTAIYGCGMLAVGYDYQLGHSDWAVRGELSGHGCKSVYATTNYAPKYFGDGAGTLALVKSW